MTNSDKTASVAIICRPSLRFIISNALYLILSRTLYNLMLDSQRLLSLTIFFSSYDGKINKSRISDSKNGVTSEADQNLCTFPSLNYWFPEYKQIARASAFHQVPIYSEDFPPLCVLWFLFA